MVDRRLTWLAGVVLLWGGAIFYKLVSLQVLHHRLYSQLARARQELVIEIPGPRGTIFDRTGRPLALSVPTESVYINPLRVPDLEIASDLLARALHLDRTQLYGTMKLAYDNHRGFLWVKRRIEFNEGQELRGMHLEWVGFQKESQRHYPKGTLAAHVLGSVDFEEKGNAGIEKTLDSELRGQPGQMRILTDVKRRGIDSQLATQARPGTSITTTIDERLQFVAERELAAAVVLHHAVSGSLVVMNPNTGDVLALASYPTYDPNVPAAPGENFARQNHAVSVPFEPGSVYKVITLSAALETTSLRPDSLINCHGGVLALPGRVIHDSHAGIGIIPMAMVLARSSNIGAIEIGMRVGSQNMYDYMRRFGFGQKSGVQLPAESPGKVRKLSRWGTTSLASVSMGQEVSVTTLQLAQAAAVIANGGLLVRPRLVSKRAGEAVPVPVPVRILRPETAITMRQMMEGVVINPQGTGKRARLAGYTVGGKTGSAQIYDFASRHYTHSYNGTFVGFAPLINPAIVVVVTLNGTHGEGGFGGVVAAPVFHAVATEALRVMEVPKDLPDELPNTLVAGNNNLDDLAIADAEPGQPNILEEGDDEGQPADQPKPVFVGPVAPIEAKPGFVGPIAPSQPKPVMAVQAPPPPTVPNFKGKTLRAVLAEAAAKGLTVLPDGSGVARVQSPPPGSILHQGDRIRVQFER
ncbi:MAG: transpeptidase family protein [Acidobacteriia bacterium]|nr:transpeptidase family protein [Terriglobia bacterium]